MNKRITWLDSIKGLMIIFVIMCHSLILDKNIGLQGHIDSVMMYIITIFIMPVFFAVSGFLYNRIHSWHQYGILWYKKSVGLVIPYLILSILLHYYMNAKNSLLSVIYQPIFIMWFLFALFFIFIIVGTLDLLNISMGIQFIVYIIVMLFQTRLNWWDGPNFDMNPVTCVLGYIFFFYLGFLIKHYFKFFKSFLSNKSSVFILVIVFVISVLIQIRYTGIFPYNTDIIKTSDIITKVISVITFFDLFVTFRFINISWLDIIGRNTLVIYLVHYFAVHTIFIWIMNYTIIKSPIIQSGFRFIAGILLSLVMVWVTKNVDIIKFVFYPRKYLDKVIL